MSSGADSHRKVEPSHQFGLMFAILYALGMFVVDMFKSRRRIEAENLFLRHQLNIALRQAVPTGNLKHLVRKCESGDAFARCAIFAD